MSVKISQLSELSDAPLTGLVPVVVGGATRKTTLSDIIKSVTGGTITSLTFSGNLKADPNPVTTTGNVYFYLPGMILPYAGSTPPSGWVFCNGQALNRVTNKELYDVILTTYGSGDGSTTFNVPDLRGRIPFGKAFSSTEVNLLTGEAISPNIYTLGATGGFEKHLLANNQTAIRDHSHTGSGKKRIYGQYQFSMFGGDCSPPGSYGGSNQGGDICGGASSNWGSAIFHHEVTRETLNSSDSSGPYEVPELPTLTGTKTLQTITWVTSLPNATLPFTPVELQATASSNLSISYRVHSGPAYLQGNTLYVTGPGWVVVEAVQGGNSLFNPQISSKSFFVSHLPHNNTPPCQIVNYIIKT